LQVLNLNLPKFILKSEDSCSSLRSDARITYILSGTVRYERKQHYPHQASHARTSVSLPMLSILEWYNAANASDEPVGVEVSIRNVAIA